MNRRRLAFVGVLVAIAIVIAMTGRPRPTANPLGMFSFGVMGDAPYRPWEEIQYRLLLREIDAYDVAWVIHVGDIFWRPCTDEHYVKALNRFNHLRHPLIYSPGDNEWTDCWEEGSGSFAPLERLARLRQIFFADPSHSLGGKRMELIHQTPEFIENARWQSAGIVFATVNLAGSDNAMKRFPGRTAADDEAARRRTEAAAAWLREAFAVAKASGARAVVVGFQANPSFEERFDHAERQPFEPFLATLEEEVERFEKPVLVVHGDGHRYIVDHPLIRRTTGRRLSNFTRMQVPGSPEVGWVRVYVSGKGSARFAFEEHVVPAWKYW